MGVSDAIAEAFGKCATGTAPGSGLAVITDFTAVVKVLWPVLDNNVSLCDLSGIFTISSPSRSDGALDLKLFTEFLMALAKIKYPTANVPIERLLNEIINAKSVHFGNDNALFGKLIDRHVIRVLLKFDLPLRRAFSAFAGDESMARVGGNLNWEDVKSQNIGMEIQGFTNFCSSYSLIPDLLSAQQCVHLTKDVLHRFPVLESETRPLVLLYPQFQLLLALAAATVTTKRPARPTSGSLVQKSKMVTTAPAQDPKRLADSLSDLLKSIGVNVMPSVSDRDMFADVKRKGGADKRGSGSSLPPAGEDDRPPAWAAGAVSMPTSDHPLSVHEALQRPGGEAGLLRLQHIFGEIARELEYDRSANQGDSNVFASNNYSRTFSAMALSRTASQMASLAAGAGEVAKVGPEQGDEGDVFFALPPILWESDPAQPAVDDAALFDARMPQLVVKPMVVGDAVPPPLDCALPVLHLLEAALAHHNLGSYEEALKFLEAARSTLVELARMEEEEVRRKAALKASKSAAVVGEGGGREGQGQGEHKEMSASASAVSAKTECSSSNTNICFDPTLGLNIPPTPQQSRQFESQTSLAGDRVTIPFDIDMYVTICMGNIYQSSGDDEQALVHYNKGWTKAKSSQEWDWAAVCLNSVGLVAYYNLRYELGYQCFLTVADYRAKEYGIRSVDTSSSWNNQGCCLFGLSKHTEARVVFERALHVLDAVLGSRHPRTAAVFNNVEKAKRSLGIKMHIKDMKESIGIRPDSDRLLIGSKYIIRALPPPESKKKGLKKKAGGKKKKK
jgi:tetratricopeptide (TPR) repeat protein